MPSQKLTSILSRNSAFTSTYTPPPSLSARLASRLPSQKGTAIISCSDPRIPPEYFLSLSHGEAAIIRNAGGRTQDALRSILALDAVGELDLVIVVHHTDCGMSHTTESGFSKTAARHPEQPSQIFGAIDDPEKTIKEDVDFLKGYKSLREQMEIVGFVLETETGVVRQVV